MKTEVAVDDRAMFDEPDHKGRKNTLRELLKSIRRQHYG